MATETTELVRQAIAWAASEHIPMLDWWGTGEEGRVSIVLRLDQRQVHILFIDWNAELHYHLRLYDRGKCVGDTMTTDYRLIVREFLKGNRRTIELATVSSPMLASVRATVAESLSELPHGSRWVITATEVPEVES